MTTEKMKMIAKERERERERSRFIDVDLNRFASNEWVNDVFHTSGTSSISDARAVRGAKNDKNENERWRERERERTRDQIHTRTRTRVKESKLVDDEKCSKEKEWKRSATTSTYSKVKKTVGVLLLRRERWTWKQKRRESVPFDHLSTQHSTAEHASEC